MGVIHAVVVVRVPLCNELVMKSVVVVVVVRLLQEILRQMKKK
jgi:hypothetical protein